MTDEDAQFFQQYPDRQAHIREPRLVLEKTVQRGVRYVQECAGEFWSLGDHDKKRRRILLWKVPATNPAYDPDKRPILKVPFLLHSDETVEDRDDILLPILHAIMTEAKAKYG